eukprot:704211_1
MLFNIATVLIVICSFNSDVFYVHSLPVLIINDPPNYERIPSRSNSIGSIDILDEIYVQFDFIIHSWNSQNSLLHFGNAEDERFPEVWLDGHLKCCNSRVQKGVEWMQSISQNNIIRDHVEDSKVQKRKVKGLQITDEGVPGIHDRAEDAIHDIAIDGVGSELENKVPQGERREGSTVEKGDEYATKGTNDDDCIGNDEFVIKGDDEVNFTRTNK